MTKTFLCQTRISRSINRLLVDGIDFKFKFALTFSYKAPDGIVTVPPWLDTVQHMVALQRRHMLTDARTGATVQE